MSQEKSAGAGLPALSKSTIWMINFGFLGVQTAFTLQSSQMSRIFQTIGADPDRKSTRLNSSHELASRMPSSA